METTTAEVMQLNTRTAVDPASSPMLENSAIHISTGYLAIKRIFDVVASACAGLLLLIPMLVIGFLIRRDSHGPAIFRQRRMGKDGKEFVIYKFRTMYLDAPHDVATNDLTDLPSVTTKLGAFLRKTSLDELPQLLNVIKGDMSLVGYRPVCLTETELNRLRMERGVFTLRPGITGYAQVSGRDNVTALKKADMDAYYTRNCGVALDLWCIYKTFAAVLTQEGAK